MKRLPTEYIVWYQMDKWGTLSQTVQAIDVQDAIKQVVDPIRQKYGDVEIFITTVNKVK